MRLITVTEDELRQMIKEAVNEALSVQAVKPLYTLQEACKLFDIDPKTLRRWATDGVVTIRAIAGRRYVTGASITNKLH